MDDAANFVRAGKHMEKLGGGFFRYVPYAPGRARRAGAPASAADAACSTSTATQPHQASDVHAATGCMVFEAGTR